METFQPDIGDTVEVWNNEAELWETGTVIAYGADRRLYFIQPDDKDQPECLIGYTGIRPVSDQKPPGRMSALEFELDYWKNRAEVTHLQHVAANKRADEAEDELDEMRRDWDAAEARVEELEDQNRILRADRDQFKIERDEALRASQKTSPVPKAVIDGQGDEWTLNRDTGYYEISDLYENLEYIERRWGIEERIY